MQLALRILVLELCKSVRCDLFLLIVEEFHIEVIRRIWKETIIRLISTWKHFRFLKDASRMLTHTHIRILKELLQCLLWNSVSYMHMSAHPLFKMNTLIIMDTSCSIFCKTQHEQHAIRGWFIILVLLNPVIKNTNMAAL
jgi:hypothetical protein